MKRCVLVAASLLLAFLQQACSSQFSTSTAEPIPSYLVGVWANDGAVMEGPLLFEGQAMYLEADGIGAIVVGPPPIAARIVATFDPATNRVSFDLIERGEIVGHGRVTYDPGERTIDLGAPRHDLLRRRFAEVTDATKKALGL